MSKMIELKHHFHDVEEVIPMMEFFSYVSFEDCHNIHVDGYIVHDDVVLLSWYDGAEETKTKEVTLDALKGCLVHSVTIYERWDNSIEDDIQHLMVEVEHIDFDNL